MNAITLLKDDHRTVEKLFVRFEKAGPKAYAAKREIVERIIEELSVHAAIEEQVLYPAARLLPDLEDETLEALEEHHIVKWVLSELDGMPADSERYTAKVTVLIENVRHHVEEEESDLFPDLADKLSSRQLDELGDRLAKAKTAAPTRPHPRSPDTPPGNLVVGPAAAIADRVTEKVRDLASSAIDRVTGNGSDDVVDDVVTAVEHTADAARETAEKTVRSARRATAPARKRASSTRKKAASAAKTSTRKASSSTTSTRKAAGRKASTSTASTRKAATRTASTTKKAAKRVARKTGSAASTSTTKAKSAAKKAPSTRTARSTAKRVARKVS